MPQVGASNPIRIVFPTSDEGELLVADRRQAIIHTGLEWTASFKNPDAAPIADNANFDVLFVTANSEARINYRVSASGNYELLIYENPTVTNNGTRLFRRNHNRASDNRPTAQVYHTPIIGAVGADLLINEFSFGPSLGGDGFADWIFAENSAYLIRLTNRSGANADMSIVVTWDE